MSLPQKRYRIALTQRFIAHYRRPLFEKLHKLSQYDWSFFCDTHPGGAASGLAAPGYGDLDVRPLHNKTIIGPIIYQSGITVDPKQFQVLMLDLGWTLISNPKYLLEAKCKGVRRIGWSKGIAQEDKGRKSPLRRAYERTIVRQCDALVVYGRISKDYFCRLGYPEEKIFIAQNTIDTARIIRERDLAVEHCARLKQRLQLGDRPIVGFLGKMAAFKQVNKIIAAYELARRQGLDALLVLAGKGPQQDAIETQIAASPFREDIRLNFDVPAGAELGYFQLFDLYLSFSQGGLAILEAMAHARPVLSTPERFPETEMLVDGETAFLSADFSVETFARRMLEAMADGVQRRAVAERGERCVAREATQEKMVEAIDHAVAFALGA